MRLAFVGHFLKVDHDSGFVCFDGVFHHFPLEIVPGVRVGEHLGHFLGVPIDAGVVIDQAHHGNFHVHGFHPLMELVFFENGDGLVGSGLGGVLSVFIIDDGDGAIGSYGMKLLRNEKVQVFVVAL